MDFQTTATRSSSDRVAAILLATVSMFVLGYTATRVYLSQPASESVTAESGVVAHQASMWSVLGE